MPAGVDAKNAPKQFSAVNIAGANAGKQVAARTLGFLNVNTADAAGKVTIYDGADANGVKVGVFDATKPGAVPLNVGVSSGKLFVVTAGGALDVTLGVM